MSTVADTRSPQESCAATAKKLVQAAALAAALVPLGSVAADAAVITVFCEAEGGPCSGTGSYVASGGATVSNIWGFFDDDDNLVYTFEIEGVPTSTFELEVTDVVTSQVALLDGPALASFPDAVCLPTFDAGECGLFDVFVVGEDTATWDPDGYYVTITWFVNSDPLSQPPDDGNNYILQAKDEFGGTIFTNQLTDTDYDPQPTPEDPALGGRGSTFSRFGAFRTVPEPATLLLLGTGLATALYRRRKIS